MPVRTPEELDRLFSQAFNAGNLEALVALYEPEGSLTPEPGKVVSGAKAIREALRTFLATKPTITLESKTLATAGDIALTSAKWKLTGTGPDGNPITMNGHSAEVSRRQSDGTWLFVIDNPWGLEWDE